MLGIVASSVLPLPLVTLNATTNFNQNLATLNATVDGQGLSTAVTAEYSSNSGSTWSSQFTMTGSPVYSSTALYKNVTGLANGTSYIVRIVASNAKGSTTVQNSNGNFTTWSVKTFIQSTAGSFSVSVPSVTPTGSNAIAPTIFDIALFGGGGGANYAGGGGGGYRVVSSKSSSATGTQNVTGSVGAGGGGGNGGGGAGGATAGGSSTLTIGDTTYTAGGGGTGAHVGSCGAPSGTGGSVGSGDNPAYGGGSNTYGYYTIVGYTYVCTQYDKLGINCEAGYYDYNQPIYGWVCDRYAGGGGGGTSSGGTSAYTQSSATHVGGNGGNGYDTGYGLRGGAGGGGGGTQGFGSTGTTSGTSTLVGTGGQGWYGAGVAGGVTFKYYGP